ncbi:DUF2206 domain-containing protein [Chloroflexota bacterium]
MRQIFKDSDIGKVLLPVLILLIITDLSIFLNIPILRQVLGFAFFSVMPGLLILNILKLNKLNSAERIVLSIGISISLLMLLGLFMNYVYPMFGFDAPFLNNLPTIFFTIVTLILAIIAYVVNRSSPSISLSNLKLKTIEYLFLLIPVFFPILSIVGMYLMNATQNNIILMIMLFLIPAYVILIGVFHNQVPQKIYPLIILLTSLSIVLLMGLRSSHLIGYDIHKEYYIFQQTILNGHWQVVMNNPLDSALSISILPAMYQSFVNIDSEFLFKLLYPTIFSILPLVIYYFSRKYIGNLNALFASFFFMSQSLFLSSASNPRTTVAIFFFALSLTVLFLDNLDYMSKRVLFLLFSFSVIISHYSTAYIFLSVLFLTWIIVQVMSKIPSTKKLLVLQNNSMMNNSLAPISQADSPNIFRPRYRSYINSNFVILFFASIFLWYSQATGVAWEVSVYFIKKSLESLVNFLIVDSRSTEVAALLGADLETKGIPHQVEFIIAWSIIVFIAIGVIATIVRALNRVRPDDKAKEITPIQTSSFDAEFIAISIACSGLLVIFISVPFIFVGYSMSRTFAQMMVVLSPYFIVGSITVAKFLRIQRAHIIITLVVLILFFSTTTGLLYQVFGFQRAITLNSSGTSYDILYVHDQEVNALRWLKENSGQKPIIYADSYGSIRSGLESNTSEHAFTWKPIKDMQFDKGYIFLRYQNVSEGKLISGRYQLNDIANYQHIFTGKAKIYNNGGSEIYK